MTEPIEATLINRSGQRSSLQSLAIKARLQRRYRAERRFRWVGVATIMFSGLMLSALLGTIIVNGMGAFWQSRFNVEIMFDPEMISPSGSREPEALALGDYQALVRRALLMHITNAGDRSGKRALMELVSDGAAYALRDMVMADPGIIGSRRKVGLLASDLVDQFVKGNIPRNVSTDRRKISDHQIAWIDSLRNVGVLTTNFTLDILTCSNSRQPELAGVWGALIGSIMTMLVTLALAVPVGVSGAVYLEEFAAKTSWTDMLEVNINNLAAVPSIVFGLLGLSMFLNVFGMPRSSVMIGGVVLALMTLPTIIIAARSALKAVPPSIREAALGVGASKLQVVMHHVLPLAAPGILTGTILGLARALGETAPLLLIGMVAFVVDVPASLSDPSTVLPVQIYMWSGASERGWIERTSAAIMLLLLVLIVMNAVAVFLRKKFERRW
ncbi:MAG: phosphate ABC transporter permease PstA [Rhodospirillaceae bacterium]